MNKETTIKIFEQKQVRIHWDEEQEKKEKTNLNK